MKHLLYSIFFLLLPLKAHSAEFTSLVLSSWNKEELTRDHLRFTHPQKKGITIHLQVDSYDPNTTWDQKTLSSDIANMAKVRRTTSAFLGITNYQIQTYKYQVSSSQNILELAGSYSRLGQKLIHFKEINFYHQEHFLQLKIISEKDLSLFDSESLIREINPEQVDID